jgi:hypothetical protein
VCCFLENKNERKDKHLLELCGNGQFMLRSDFSLLHFFVIV